MLEVLTYICLIASGIPLLMFAWNIALYRRLPEGKQVLEQSEHAPRISVLIPARNEAKNIEASLLSVLSSQFSGFELIVMDDHSTDDTAVIVGKLAATHPNLRLVQAPPLPVSWCGKQHACFQLAKLSKGDKLLFLDADVRLSPNALERLVAFMDNNKAALASGVPRQTFSSV